jgi:hypothetical protein
VIGGGNGGNFTGGTGNAAGSPGGHALSGTGGNSSTVAAGNGGAFTGGAATSGAGGNGLTGTGGASSSGTPGAGILGDGAAAGYGVVAQADTTSPVRAALRIVPQNAAATTALAGDVYFDSVLVKLRVYSGTAWETVTSI